MRKEIYQPSRQSKPEVINKNRAVINSQSLESELSNNIPSITKKNKGM